jgi:hypothetical protein
MENLFLRCYFGMDRSPFAPKQPYSFGSRQAVAARRKIDRSQFEEKIKSPLEADPACDSMIHNAGAASPLGLEDRRHGGTMSSSLLGGIGSFLGSRPPRPGRPLRDLSSLLGGKCRSSRFTPLFCTQLR